MARRAEEEVNHWPGFVDALSTIVMVVTFLLIILGIVIFVISLQINDPTEQVSESSSGIQVAEIEQELVETSKVVVELSDVVEQQELEIERLSREITEAAAKAEEARRAQAQAEARVQAGQEDAGDTKDVLAPTPVATLEIVVPRVEQDQGGASRATSEVQTAQAVMIVRFEENAVELNEESSRQAQEFLEQNDVLNNEQQIVAMSFYDGETLSVSQAKRTAYYRLLSVRNALLDSGVDGARISISVLPAPGSGEGANSVNSVRVFLR